MNLIMFDIDGTLTETNAIDADLYVQAVKESLNVTKVDTNWERYHNATDPAIAAEIIEEKIGRLATVEDLDSIRKSFVNMVQAKASKEPRHFREIAGAKAMLTELVSFPNVAIAIATGTWKEIALLKLNTASLVLPEVVIATASDAFSREEIMRIAEKRTVGKFKNASLDSIVYVGDAVWDVRAALKIGYQFIGVGTGKRAAKLRDEGATWIIPDYNDKQRFFTILEKMWNAQ